MRTIPEKIRAIREALNLTQIQLAERLGVSQSTVNRWLTGAKPEGERRDAINALYADIAVDGNAKEDGSTVSVMGYVGAGAEIEPEFEQLPHDGLEQVWVPFPLPADMIAFEVRGDSMLPVYKNGHIVICYREQKRPIEAFYGDEAAVRTSDGRRFIKTIMRGARGVNLMSFNAALIEEVELDWIGEIFATLPRNSIKKVVGNGGLQGRLKLQAQPNMQRD